MLEDVSQVVSVPIIASGGAGSSQHILEVFEKTAVTGALAEQIYYPIARVLCRPHVQALDAHSVNPPLKTDFHTDKLRLFHLSTFSTLNYYFFYYYFFISLYLYICIIYSNFTYIYAVGLYLFSLYCIFYSIYTALIYIFTYMYVFSSFLRYFSDQKVKR